MRVLIIEDSVEMGGVQHSTLNLLRESKKDQKNTFVLMVPNLGVLYDNVQLLDVPCFVYNGLQTRSTSISRFNDKLRLPNLVGILNNLIISYLNYKRLSDIVMKEGIKADIILTKGMKSHLPGSRLGREIKCPVVWHMQDFITDSYFGLYRALFSALASKFSSGVIADGSPILDNLSKKVKKKASVVFNGIEVNNFYLPGDKERIKSRLGLKTTDYVIGNVARIVPWKGQLDIVQAFCIVANRFPNLKLVLVGSPLFGKGDYLATIKKYISNNNLQDRVLLLGYVTNLEEVYTSFDVFVYSSVEKDTCPLALLGALAAGNALIVSDIPGVREIVENAPICKFYQLGNLRQLEELLVNQITTDVEISDKENMEFAKLHFDNSVHYRTFMSALLEYC
jgi:glycosyltransferase involved in cell wall biosynthesis